MNIRIIFATFLVFSILAESHARDSKKPNLILIMADDLGYHDLACYGHPKIKTPVLDKMAREGVRLTSFYSGATVCTPSRMALLTGAYPARLGWKKGVLGYGIHNTMGCSQKALTIAEIYKRAGYATAITGKWHLGDRTRFLPPRQGFDHTYYIKRSNNQTKELWRGDKMVEKPFNNRLLTEQFAKDAITFIKAQGEKPFFLYLPFTAPHFPVQSHPDWKGKSAFGAYGDVVEEMDHRIGEIFKTLQELKIDKRTIVVFLSDNGPEPREQAQAKPYRGRKWDSLEGGTRVPCIVWYPAAIRGGQTCEELVAAIDLLPTLAHACGIDLKTARADAPHKVDGVNVWSTLVDREDAEHQRTDLLYWHGMNGFHAIRMGDWKLFKNRHGAKHKSQHDGPVLIHLKNDVEELTNVAAKYPGRVKEMQELADKRLADIQENIIPLGQ
jgi:arylsulfatase A-like enzyme